MNGRQGDGRKYFESIKYFTYQKEISTIFFLSTLYHDGSWSLPSWEFNVWVVGIKEEEKNIETWLGKISLKLHDFINYFCIIQFVVYGCGG